jgi:hypothetical protein
MDPLESSIIHASKSTHRLNFYNNSNASLEALGCLEIIVLAGSLGLD